MDSLFPDFPVRHIPEYTKVDYRPPIDFPDFSQNKWISLDLETQGLDPLRGAFICGVGLQTPNSSQYYPIRHLGGPNCDESNTLRWLSDNLKQFTGELIGANSNLFDCFFLATKGIYAPQAKFMDIQWSEPLLDEYAMSYSLETLGQKYLNRGKETYLEELYGPDWKEYFSEIHPGHAAKYVLTDLDLPPAILEKQKIELARQNLTDLFNLECRLTPLLIDMKLRGVPVDIPKAEKLEKELRGKYQAGIATMNKMVDLEVDPYSGQSIAKAFDSLKIRYPLTDKGNPSFKGAWLKNLNHPFATLLNETREFEKLRGTFIEGYILNGHINGRIHANFHPLRKADEGGEKGTVSGRFSSTEPNLQNIPTRTELGKLIRELFISEQGMKFYAADYSQMEYRLLVHYATIAKCRGVETAQKAYSNNPDTDFHAMVAELTGLERKPAKNLNFGLCYGMGIKKLAASLNLVDKDGEPLPEALEIMDTYHERAPFIKDIYNKAAERAQKNGYVKTILGRHCRFDLYEPRWREEGSYRLPLPYQTALNSYGSDIKRAGTHKALNRVLQGSNADATKQAMVNIWESGLLKEGNITLGLTVHDELDGSVATGWVGEKALKRLKEYMTDAVKLNVPVLVSAGIGDSWASAH